MTCVACSGSGSTNGSRDSSKGQLVWGKSAEPDLLDPTIAGTGIAWELLQLSYERLVGLDGHLKIVPELATSWQQKSPTTYVFDLRKGVRFSNGREMTVDDVVDSFKRLIDPKISAFWAGQLGIRSITAFGNTQVKFSLKAPKTAFVAALAASPAAILPMKELNAGEYDPAKELLGTGPFTVASHSQGESWTFVPNRHYWRSGVPGVSKLTVRIMPDDAARAAALRAGSIDFTTFETPDSIQVLKGQANVKTVVQSTTDYYVLYANSKQSVFRDDRVRQALAMTIDRNKIKNVALGGVGQPTASASVAFSGVCDPGAVPFAKPDVQRARELVAAAGATGKTVDIIATSSTKMSGPIAQVIQRDLESVGLKVRILSLDPGEALKRDHAGTFDLFIGWFAGYADPGMALAWWNPAYAGFNKAWANSDAQLNTLIDKSLATAQGPARSKSIRDACTRIAQDAVMIPLITKDAIVSYRSDRVSTVIPPVEGFAVPLRHIAEFRAK